MKKGINILLICLALASSNIEAGELGINIYGVSYHFDRQTHDGVTFNEFNPGLGLNYIFQDHHYFNLAFEAGLYKDSVRNPARFAGVNFRYKLYKDFIKPGFILGLFRSDSVSDDWIFVVIPGLTSRYQSVSFNLVYIPEFDGINAYDSIGFYLTIHL